MVSSRLTQVGVFAVLFLVVAAPWPAGGAEITLSTTQLGAFYGPYMPSDLAPPAYPPVPAPDNSPIFQNYFLGRSTIGGVTTSERRAFFLFDMATVGASIPAGEELVGVTIDLELLPGGTSALANFTGGFEMVALTGTTATVAEILDPFGEGVPPEVVWGTFGTGAPFGSFVISGPSEPVPTPPGVYTIGLPGAVGAASAAIGSGSMFIVTARLLTFDPGPIGFTAPPPVDPYEYVFGLTDVETPTGIEIPAPVLTLTTAPVPEASSLALGGLALAVGCWFARMRGQRRQ